MSRENIGGAEPCSVEGCLNTYTPTERDGELRCVTHE